MAVSLNFDNLAFSIEAFVATMELKRHAFQIFNTVLRRA